MRWFFCPSRMQIRVLRVFNVGIMLSVGPDLHMASDLFASKEQRRASCKHRLVAVLVGRV